MRGWLLVVLLVMMGACGPEPTPFPAEVPVTPTATPQPTAVPSVRYALAPNTLNRIAEYDRIEASAQLEQLTEPVDLSELGGRYDIVARYGAYPNWTRSEITPNAMLVISPVGQPVTMQLGDIILRRVNPPALAEALDIPGVEPLRDAPPADPADLRAELANLGRPDGLVLTLGHTFVPGIAALVDQLADINVEINTQMLPQDELLTALENNAVQLALVTWVTAEEQALWQEIYGREFTVDLYTLPISYQAVPELNITFTPGGWPIATR